MNQDKITQDNCSQVIFKQGENYMKKLRLNITLVIIAVSISVFSIYENLTAQNPLRIVVIYDISGSMQKAYVDTLKVQDLDILVKLIKTNGGELAFGLLKENSNRPLIRLPIEAPPIRPTFSTQSNNVFEKLLQNNENKNILSKYIRDSLDWVANVDPQINEFKTKVQTILDQHKTAVKSDVWNAVLRCDIFLSEPDDIWGKKASRYAILISDGIHNSGGKHRIPQNPNIEWIIVNGIGSVGALCVLKPKIFESPRAAFEYILSRGVK